MTGRGQSKSRKRDPERQSGTSTRLILLTLAAVLMVAATAAMTAPAGTQEFGIISAEFESERPTVIPQGTSNDLPYRLSNAGLVPVHAYVDPASEGVRVDPGYAYVESRSEAEVTMTLEAPEETGYYRRFVTEHRYLALLPEPIVRELYTFHPWAPIVVIDVLLGGALYALGVVVLGSGRARWRRRTRDYSPSWERRLKELLY